MNTQFKIYFNDLKDLISHRFELGDIVEGYVVCWWHYFKDDFSEKEKPCIKTGTLLDKCEAPHEFLRGEMEELVEEINLNKYYLGKKEGHNVKLKDAEKDYVAHHATNFGIGYRSCYCNRVCPNRQDCNMEVKEKEIMKDEAN